MPYVRVNLEIDGVSAYNRAFEAFGAEASDLREPLADVADVIRESVGEQFRSEGAHAGDPWQPLSPAYEVWKEQHFPGRPLLVRTADMRTAALDPEAFHIEPKRLVYEVDDDKAIYHQRGAGDLPERRIVSLTYSDRRAIDRCFAHWLNDIRRGPIGRPVAAIL